MHTFRLVHDDSSLRREAVDLTWWKPGHHVLRRSQRLWPCSHQPFCLHAPFHSKCSWKLYETLCRILYIDEASNLLCWRQVRPWQAASSAIGHLAPNRPPQASLAGRRSFPGCILHAILDYCWLCSDSTPPGTSHHQWWELKQCWLKSSHSTDFETLVMMIRYHITHGVKSAKAHFVVCRPVDLYRPSWHGFLRQLDLTETPPPSIPTL